jgi:hypothetical protein
MASKIQCPEGWTDPAPGVWIHHNKRYTIRRITGDEYVLHVRYDDYCWQWVESYDSLGEAVEGFESHSEAEATP